ncbi:hypothetical protein [uncultured Thiodictyon sp.]|jgi:hypothetical protein|uniref:hypothetical protein n=1 Tax=uncultured Thiodictyon sp. TaxID=1846217 RepID=UPI0025D8F6CD|nr:hypothetical protein [uncultured Thiodictyon sp.]
MALDLRKFIDRFCGEARDHLTRLEIKRPPGPRNRRPPPPLTARAPATACGCRWPGSMS